MGIPEQCPAGDGQFDFAAFMRFQCEEICRHRYLESEKANRDLGASAEVEWVRRYAKPVREWAVASGLFVKK